MFLTNNTLDAFKKESADDIITAIISINANPQKPVYR